MRWTPDVDVGYLYSSDLYPFQVRTKSLHMQLWPHKTLEKLYVWKIVKKSGMCRDAGYELFSDQCFQENNIISVYVGKKVTSISTYE